MADDLGGWDNAGEQFQFAPAGVAKSFSEKAADVLIGGASLIGSDLTNDPDTIGARFRTAIDAADKQALYTSNLSSRQSAAEDAYDEAIARIQKLTGQQLENPIRDGYISEARQRLKADPSYTESPRAGVRSNGKLQATAAAIFQERLDALRRDNRDVATDLTFDPATAAKGLAMRADVNAARASEKLPGALNLVASLIGGMTGQRRDPLFWASMFVGPGLSTAKTVAGRVAMSALTQGAFNAGVSALEQPAVQAWRREAGLRNGVMPAIEEVGFAFLSGAIPGATIQGGVEAFRALRPALQKIFNGTASPAEVKTTLEALQPGAAKKLAPVIDQAERAATADAATAAEIPDNVRPAAHDAAIVQTTRHLEDPENVPPPETARPIPPPKADEAPIADKAPLLDPGARVMIDGKPVTFERLDPRQLGTDAAAMQYKSNGDASGVTDRLRNVTRWDPIAASKVIVYEFADGRRVIADGHQRLGLAKRLLNEGREQTIALDGFVFREADGWKPADIRALAAKKNMQEGSGSPIDAARVLRDRPDLLDGSLPTTSQMMKSAVNLARLSDDAFGMVLNGSVPENYAAAVGALAPDPATHSAIMADLVRAAPATEREARLLIGDALSSGFRTEEQINLFGAADMVRSLLAERAKILSSVLKQLQDDKKVFGVLASRADVIEAAGNALDRTGNEVRAATAEQLGELVVKLAQRTGPVSDRLNRVAQQLADGQIKAPAAARMFLDDVQRTLERDGLAALLETPRLAPGQSAEPGTAEALAIADAGELQAARDTQTVDMFAPPPRVATVADLTAGQRGWTFDELYAQAEKLQPEIAQAGKAIEAATGAKFKDPGVKDKGEAFKKIARKGYVGPWQLTDTARGGFEVTSAAQADEVVAQLQATFDALDEGWSVNKTGYFDRKVLVRHADGVVGEIQIFSTEILKAKKESLGAKYQAWRVMKEGPEADALLKEMQDGYFAAVAGSDFTGIFERSRRPNMPSNVARQEASSINPAVLTTSAKSTDVQGAPGSSTANADLGSSTAGRQSQLQNSMGGSPGETIGAAADMRNQTIASESTPIGEQNLIPGVDPVTTRQKLEAAAAKPMTGGDRPPPAGGLFDQGARDQVDIFDLLPVASADDGAGTRLMSKAAALEEADRFDFFADITDACKVS